MSALTDSFTAIANAIRAKTGKSATMTPAQMPTEIASINTATGNATAADVASGKTFSSSSGSGLTGTAIIATGNATAADVRAGKTFSSANGAGLTGTAIIATGNATASHVKSGKTFSNASAAGLTGTAIISSGNATVDDVLSGCTFSNSTSSGLTGSFASDQHVTPYTNITSNQTYIYLLQKTLTSDRSRNILIVVKSNDTWMAPRGFLFCHMAYTSSNSYFCKLDYGRSAGGGGGLPGNAAVLYVAQIGNDFASLTIDMDTSSQYLIIKPNSLYKNNCSGYYVEIFEYVALHS